MSTENIAEEFLIEAQSNGSLSVVKAASQEYTIDEYLTDCQRDDFQSITEIASQICNTPSAMINFLDDEYQWTMFNTGWRNTKIPRKDSICQFTAKQNDLLYITDTAQDHRLMDVHAVQDDPEIGFYAGINIKCKLGNKLGTLCVIDDKPRKLTRNQKKALKTLADEIRARLELIRSKRRLEDKNKTLVKTSRFLKNSADIMLILHPESLIIEEVHAEVQGKLGYHPEELIFTRLTEYCTNKNLTYSISNWLDQEVSEKLSIETDFQSQTGEQLCLSLHISKADNRLFVTGRDISKQKKAENQLKKEKEMMEGIIQNLPGIFCLIDSNGTIRRWNRNLESITGYSSDELESVSIEHFLIYDDIEIAFQKLEEVFKHEYARSEFTIVSKSGKQIPFLVTGFRHLIDDESLAVIIGVNITEQKQTLIELNEKEERLKIALKRLLNAQHIAKLGSWEWDNQEKTLYWSDETYELLNLKKGEVNPSHDLILKLVHPDDKDEFSSIIKNALSGKGFKDFEHDLLLADNIVKHVYMRGEVFNNEKGKPVKVIGTIQDITEQKQAEQKLKKTLKEREVLLAEIHHRVKNNLAVISGLLQIELMNMDDDLSTSVLSNGLTRIKSIALVHEKLYSSDNFKNISLKSYVKDLVKTIENKYQKGRVIQVKTKIDDTKLNINLAVPAGLLLNELLTNAFKHAFPDRNSGIITINIESQNDQISIGVSDNGVGLPGDFDLKNRKTVGFTFVKVLGSQLKAEHSVESNSSGTSFTFHFRNQDNKSGSSGTIFPS